MSVHEYILWDRLGQSIYVLYMVGIHVIVHCPGGYVDGERWKRHYSIWGKYGEYLFTGGDVQSSMILDE
jgi:hypothetical protein